MYLKKIFLVLALLIPGLAWAQFQGTERPAGDSTLVLSLEDAIRIALSENTSVKVADMEIQRQKYAHKGTYAALFPQVNGSGSYQRTIKKQVMTTAAPVPAAPAACSTASWRPLSGT